LALGRQLCELAARRGDAGDLLAADRSVGHVLHLMGEHAQARDHLASRLEPGAKPALHSHLARYCVDQCVAARCTLARILWIQGFPERARAAADDALEQARTVGHTSSLRYALAHAGCTISILMVDLDAAERNVALLRGTFPRPAPRYWHALSRSFEGQVLIERGAVARGLPLLQGALDELRELGFEGVCRPFFGALSLGHAAAGQLPEALASIENAIAYAARSDERWSLPEWLRIKAQLLLLEDPACSGAEALLRQGLDCARRQGAATWEQRCATSLARLWDRHGTAGALGGPPGAIGREFAPDAEVAA
jgi:hypothetical protein